MYDAALKLTACNSQTISGETFYAAVRGTARYGRVMYKVDGSTRHGLGGPSVLPGPAPLVDKHETPKPKDQLPVARWVGRRASTTRALALPAGASRQCLVMLHDHFVHSGVNGTHHVMGFEVLGPTLLSLIKKTEYQGLSLEVVRRLAACVLIGLAHLHDRLSIIHTDLKPENVLCVLASRPRMAVTSLPSASSTPMEALPEVPAVPCTTAGMANEGVVVFTTGVDAVDLFTTGSALSAKHRAHAHSLPAPPWRHQTDRRGAVGARGRRVPLAHQPLVVCSGGEATVVALRNRSLLGAIAVAHFIPIRIPFVWPKSPHAALACGTCKALPRLCVSP